eukprot:6209457-Pleurochrysis_carterae.AAC.2
MPWVLFDGAASTSRRSNHAKEREGSRSAKAAQHGGRSRRQRPQIRGPRRCKALTTNLILVSQARRASK